MRSPTTVWLRKNAASSSVSGPSLSRIASGTATFPTSCSSAARTSSSRRSPDRPSSRPVPRASAATARMWRASSGRACSRSRTSVSRLGTAARPLRPSRSTAGTPTMAKPAPRSLSAVSAAATVAPVTRPPTAKRSSSSRWARPCGATAARQRRCRRTSMASPTCAPNVSRYPAKPSSANSSSTRIAAGRLRPIGSRASSQGEPMSDEPVKFLLPESRHPDALGQPAARPARRAAAAAATRAPGARRARRPDADLPDGADRAGGLGRAGDRDPRGGARGLQALAPDAALRARRLERALDTPAHIYYKYEGVSPAGSHKPNTAVAAGLLQQAGRDPEARDRDRRRPVGLGAGARLPAVRHGVRGVHGRRPATTRSPTAGR